MTLISRQSTKPLCPDTSPSIGNTKEADRMENMWRKSKDAGSD